MPLFRALAKNMAPMTNADESPTNRLTLFPIYLSLFLVSTLWSNSLKTVIKPKRVFQADIMLHTARILSRKSGMNSTTRTFLKVFYRFFQFS